MNKFTLVIGLLITVGVLKRVPFIYTQYTKAYSCSSSSSNRFGTTSTGVSGSSGSCATSSSSTSQPTIAIGTVRSPLPPNLETGAIQEAGSSSEGGAQSSCSFSSTNSQSAIAISGEL